MGPVKKVLSLTAHYSGYEFCLWKPYCDIYFPLLFTNSCIEQTTFYPTSHLSLKDWNRKDLTAIIILNVKGHHTKDPVLEYKYSLKMTCDNVYHYDNNDSV